MGTFSDGEDATAYSYLHNIDEPYCTLSTGEIVLRAAAEAVADSRP